MRTRSNRIRISTPVVRLRPVRLQQYLVALVVHLAALTGVLLGPTCTALADVVSILDVVPADDPFTSENEGIPPGGNFIDDLVPPDEQGNFEGRYDEVSGSNVVGEAIYVGGTDFGQLEITGISELRWEDLFIGGLPENHAEFDPSNVLDVGIVRIDGLRALYNNNPNIVPPGLPDDFRSIHPRATEEGFDLFIGVSGDGEMRIGPGGRAQIQDAVGVGLQQSATGLLTVDGFDAVLTSGGFETEDDTDPDDLTTIHYFSVGLEGIGEVNVLNGGQIISSAPAGEMSQDAFGASIGGPLSTGTGLQGGEDGGMEMFQPEPGGQGSVTVDGAGSRWIIGGGLQLGGFAGTLENPAEDPEGATGVIYSSLVGKGTLSVTNGGLVSVTNPPGAEDADPDAVKVTIGLYGVLDLLDGQVHIGNPTLGDAEIVLVSDGQIRGDGRIETGRFINRVLGRVTVGLDESLVIASRAESTGAMAVGEMPLLNWGLIEVIGGEFEIERTPVATEEQPVSQFLNLRASTTPDAGREEGLIQAQDATLRFESGLSNSALVAFTGGNTLVSGDVVNEASPGVGEPPGKITFSGASVVTMQDDLENLGDIDFVPDPTTDVSTLVVLGNFTMGGSSSLSLLLDDAPQGTQVTHVATGGNLALNGELEVTLVNSGASPTTIEEGDVFEIMSATGELSGFFSSYVPPALPTPDLFMFPFPDYAEDTVSLIAFSVAAAVGADFNGDMIVDLMDLAIWRAFLGTSGPAGDANGDGIVNGQDFVLWQLQQGGMGVPGAGSGSGSGSAQAISAPEPSSIGLMIACLLALAATGRRR